MALGGGAGAGRASFAGRSGSGHLWESWAATFWEAGGRTAGPPSTFLYGNSRRGPRRLYSLCLYFLKHSLLKLRLGPGEQGQT